VIDCGLSLRQRQSSKFRLASPGWQVPAGKSRLASPGWQVPAGMDAEGKLASRSV